MTSTSDAAIYAAARTFYWKPAMALFRALEMLGYQRAGYQPAEPVLDLGCGDGSVAGMLGDLGLTPVPVFGIDLLHEDLVRASKKGVHGAVSRANANALPFPAEAFGTIICNGVLMAITPSPAKSLGEIYRVLKPGGLLFVTVPNDHFAETMITLRWLGAISPSLRASFSQRFDRRLMHLSVYTTEEWLEQMRAAGLKVLHVDHFISSSASRVFNFLNAQPLRAFGLLKAASATPAGDVFGSMLAWLLGRWCRQDDQPGKAGTYFIVVARKP